MWSEAARLLSDRLKTTPHPFLASRFAGDIDPLIALQVQAHNVCAVERDREEAKNLYQLHSKGIRFFYADICDAVRELSVKQKLYSVYFDGLASITHAQALDSVRYLVKKISPGGVFSWTISQRKDGYIDSDWKSRVMRAETVVSESTKTVTSLTQVIRYQSKDQVSKGSPMLTMTFSIGTSKRNMEKHHDLRIRQDNMSCRAELMAYVISQIDPSHNGLLQLALDYLTENDYEQRKDQAAGFRFCRASAG